MRETTKITNLLRARRDGGHKNEKISFMCNTRISRISMLVGVLFSMGCESEQPLVEKEPELTLYSLALYVVDEETGEIVPEINESNFEFSHAATIHSNPASRSSWRMSASQEGMVFAVWIGPVGDRKGVIVKARGYEPLTVLPEDGGSWQRASMGPTLRPQLRTVKMKKTQVSDSE